MVTHFAVCSTMKPKYTPLDKLTEKSKGFKVKVKVIQKGPPLQSPSKRRYQKLLFKDDEVRQFWFITCMHLYCSMVY